MKSVLLATAALGAFSTGPLADETVKWRHVQHATAFQSQEVGDVNGHILSVARVPGIAFFPRWEHRFQLGDCVVRRHERRRDAERVLHC
jgi:hypothetical protein